MTKPLPHIVHIIVGLETGGAEMMLLNLIGETSTRLRHSVISLTAKGTLGPRVEAAGGKVIALGLGNPLSILLALPRLARLLNRLEPSLVQGWMYHGNLAASLSRAFCGLRRPLVWSIRTTMRKYRERKLTRLVVYAGLPFSYGADVILYNSQLAMTQHQAIGYARRGAVVGNGFDVERFRPDPAMRAAMRAKLDIASDAFVIGFVGRLVPVKDLPTFLAAAARMTTGRPNVVVVAVGRDIPRASTLMPQTTTDIAALGSRLHLLPETPDVPSLIKGFDALALTSLAEGFPNVIGEAMACGVPCVATDVGACRSLIADTGLIVPPADPAALAKAMGTLADMPREARAALGAKARARVVENFSLQATADVYRTIWARLAGTPEQAQ